jgi:ankyrin repeat protein
VDCAYLLTSASSSLVNVPDKRGLTALHWANAEQHVKLMKLLLAKGAVWSDADLQSMVRRMICLTEKCVHSKNA